MTVKRTMPAADPDQLPLDVRFDFCGIQLRLVAPASMHTEDGDCYQAHLIQEDRVCDRFTTRRSVDLGTLRLPVRTADLLIATLRAGSVAYCLLSECVSAAESLEKGHSVLVRPGSELAVEIVEGVRKMQGRSRADDRRAKGEGRKKA